MEALKSLNNRYQLLSIIKKGGFGIIYKGYDSVLGKDIAVKEIKPELLKDDWYVQQFQKEARNVAKMNHHNIVHIFDLVQHDDRQFYIIMEYIDGIDLGRLQLECLKRGHLLPQAVGVHIVAEVCKALDYAHSCLTHDRRGPLNLVHQDVSPSNIMVSKHGVVKLIDFGIAGVQRKAIEEESYVTLQGKVQYMSPEHVDMTAEIDKRSDLFSLGLVLYEILEGKRFFMTEESQKIIEILKNGKLKLKDFKHTPKPLQSVLFRALEKAPERRYQNANQLYIDLMTFLVLNSDSTSLDQEIAQLVLNFTNGHTAADEWSDILEIKETDTFFEDEQKPENFDDTDSKPVAMAFEFKDQTSVETIELDAPEVGQSPILPEPANRPREFTDTLTEVGDEIKTVIDVVRLSERGHKRAFVKAGLSVLAAVALFFLLDIFMRWTPFGLQAYDSLFPPAIKIASAPAGATVYLNNEALPDKTPLSIDEIKPGVYELKLSADGYKPILKSIHVASKGEAEVKGEPTRPGNQPYLFRFKTTLEIDSSPPDAEVFINGIKYGLNTPCSVTLEVGEACQLELRKNGFANLTGFSLNTEKSIEEIEDRRLWQFEMTREPATQYKVRGLFGKFFTFQSNPPDATIYLDDNPEPIGRTGQARVFLTARPHKIVFRKEGYVAEALNLNVNEATQLQIFSALSRPVKFAAFDATNGKTKDLGATITKISRNDRSAFRRRSTPTQINLPPYEYEAFFSKKGFRDAVVRVSATDREVVALLEPLDAEVTVVILDASSKLPLSNVEIRYKSLDNPRAAEILFNITDSDGTCTGNLSPGLYVFRTSKGGYRYEEQSAMIQASGLNMIEFTLKKQ
jgi:serine/threonine protein kinase